MKTYHKWIVVTHITIYQLKNRQFSQDLQNALLFFIQGSFQETRNEFRPLLMHDKKLSKMFDFCIYLPIIN